LNLYELAVVFDPQLEVDLSKATSKIEKLIKDNDGKINKTDNWGKKKLAYQINKHDHGIYVFYTLEMPGENVSKIESSLNITDEAIRYLLIRVDEKAIAKAEAAKAEKAERAKARGDSDDDEEESKE
jgi:small subunit ribosomal protein S6